MKRLIFFLVFIEIIIIISQLLNIYSKRNVLGENISANPLSKENLILNSESTLKYFYEPEPNTQNVLSLDYLNYKPSYTAIYTINNDGFNNKENYSVEKPKDTYRIVALGDSFTFGQYVNTKDNYPSQLEGFLNENLKCNDIKKFEVLNLGVPGYDIQYTVERFKLKGQKYDPDLVVWFLIDASLLRVNELYFPKADQYRTALKKTGEYNKFIKEGKFDPEFKKAYFEIVRELGEENILKLQKKYLQRMNDTYKNSLVIFTTPPLDEKYKNFLQGFIYTRKYSFFYASTNNLQNQEDLLLPDGHPTQKGYKLISEDIYNYLRENNVIPCQYALRQ